MRQHFTKTYSWSFLLSIAIVGLSTLLNNIGHLESLLVTLDVIRQIVIPLIIFSGLLAGVLLVTKFKFKLDWFQNSSIREQYRTIPLDIRLGLLLLTGLFSLFFFWILELHSYTFIYMIRFWFFVFYAIYVFFLWLALYQLVWLYLEIEDSSYFVNELKKGYVRRAYRMLQDSLSNVSLVFKLLLVFFVIFMWGLMSVLLVNAGEEGLIIYFLGTLLIVLPTITLFLMRLGYLNRVIKQTEQLTKGQVGIPIQVKGHSFIASHAGNINKLREGLSHSVTEQAKSERLKTELITNVSHDLRTPLTSIITYTDLLKNPELSAEERQTYVDVLARKSDRLKLLIDDLFDVSKMASGQVELKKSDVDLKQLIQQAIAEHQEAFEKESLELRLQWPEQDLIVYVDGQKWWRMLDNLLINAAKYSQPGTRVYVSVKPSPDQVTMTLKNTSRYELSENPDELFERFKRADEARQTEGSGLGLAIAQSIAEIHGGTLKLDIDGDLFKVTVQLKVASKPLSA